MRDYYDLLGVREDATRDEIRAAYRTIVASSHPDVNPADDAERRTALLNEAWSVLRDPGTRAAYDAAGLATSAPLRCRRCGLASADLRFVVFAHARGSAPPLRDGSMLCPACRGVEARAAAASSLMRGRYTTRRARALTLGAVARDVRGGKVDARTSAALLRQLGFAYARENRSNEALATLEAVLELGHDPAVARVVARLREAGAGLPDLVRAPARRAAFTPNRGAFALAFAAVVIALVVGSFAVANRSRGVPVATNVPAATTALASDAPLAGPTVALDTPLRDTATRLAGVARVRTDPSRYLFDLANDRPFALAYGAAVAALPARARARYPWLVTLETTSDPSDGAALPQSNAYVLARGCGPQSCDAGFVGVAYNAATHAVAGAAYFDGGWHEFGSRTLADRAMLVLAVARNRLPFAHGFALAPALERDLGRYVATIGS